MNSKTGDLERDFAQTSRSRVEMSTGPRISPNHRTRSEIRGFKDSSGFRYDGPWKVSRAGDALARSREKAEEKADADARADALDHAKRASVKVTWTKGTPPPAEASLRAALGEFGDVRNVAAKSKSALVLFGDEASAKAAVDDYAGPWILKRVGEATAAAPEKAAPAPPPAPAPVVVDPVEPVVEEAPPEAPATPAGLDAPARPVRLTAESLAALEAEHDDDRETLADRCVKITWDGKRAAPKDDGAVLAVLRVLGAGDCLKVVVRAKSAVAMFAAASAAAAAASAVDGAATKAEGHDLAKWRAALASESLKSAPEPAPDARGEPEAPGEPAEETPIAAFADEAPPAPAPARDPAPDAPAPEPVSARCVKVAYKRKFKPSGEPALAAALAFTKTPWVSAALRDKSAVLMFSSKADADATVDAVAAENDDRFSAALVQAP